MEIIFKWLLFISSYIPLFLILFLKNLKSFSKQSFLNLFKINQCFWVILLFIAITTFIVLIFWLFLLKKESNSNNKYYVKKLYPMDFEFLQVLITFIVPLLSLNPSSWPSIIMNLILLIIEGIYFVSNNVLYCNVLLMIMGYHIYTFMYHNEDNTTDKVILTRKKKDEIFFQNLKASQIGTTNIFYV